MSRRILLIDADTEFRDTLTQQIGRYRVVVMTEPDPDRALALASSDTPDLLIIAVEEPDKGGFKTFQKARKQLAAKMPIVLVTKSMSIDSFTKHRSLKVHADEYIDKRGLTKDELVGKLDNLIGLGDLQEEDVSIPVEDEIPMEIADGDVVLDEQLDDDAAAEFGNQHEMATVGGNNTVLVDQMVSQELDGAFDALLGDEEPAAPRGLPGVAPVPEPVERTNAGAIEVPDEISSAHDAEPVPEPIPEPINATPDPDGPDMSGIPEPVPHKIPDDEPEPEQPAMQSEFDELSIPERVMDGGRSSSSYEAVAGDEPNVDDLPAAPRDVHEAATPEPEQSDVEEDDIGGRDSMSSIPIEDDDMVALDDDALEEIDDSDESDESEPVEEAAIAAEEPSPAAPTLAAVPAERSQGTPTLAAPAVSEPSGLNQIPAEHARAKRATGSQASIDLGLDKLAQDAESEQSGVYDRKSLRKIGELERQIAQLKNELERARTQAEQAAKGGSRETQFLTLRESNAAKEKELKQVKASLEQQSKELAEAQEILRQTQQAKSTLEAKHVEVEQRLTEDSAKVKELAASLREATAQAAQLEQELDAKTKAASNAEAKVAQLEKDLASERASGAASASDAERKLRQERDQMVVRHKGELAALRAEMDAMHELSTGRLREELDAARNAAVEEAAEDARRVSAAQHEEAVAAIEHKHNAELIRIKSEHAGELSRVNNELGGEIERLKGVIAEVEAAKAAAIAAANEERETALASLQQERDADVAAAQRERDHAVAAVEQARDAAVTAAQRERDFAIEAVKEENRSALAAAEQQRRKQVEQLESKQRSELQAREDQYNESREREAQSHSEALAQLKQELDRTVASYETKLSNARNELEQAIAQAQQEKAELAQTHERVIAALKAANEEELTLMADGARRAAEAHRNALAEQQAKYDHQISDLQQTSARELAELAAQLQAAKRAADEAAERYETEREEMAASHAAEIAELEAKHERAIAVANGEHLKAKAVADAEHKQAIASLKSEADRMLRQLEEERTRAIQVLEAEREELRKGLSGARDSLKRSEAELASAINTIAVRNADLRAHTEAIAERDKRINELRAELESLEQENANYQEQVLRAYQKIKSDEAMVARARKAMAIALTVLDDEGNPQSSSS
jgi:hypothetical protein